MRRKRRYSNERVLLFASFCPVTLLEHGIEIVTPAHREEDIYNRVGLILKFSSKNWNQISFHVYFGTTPHSENSLVNMNSSIFNHNGQIGCTLLHHHYVNIMYVRTCTVFDDLHCH